MTAPQRIGRFSWLSRRLLAVGAAVVLVAVVASVVTVAGAQRVDGNSMRPTLRDGDRVLTNPFGGDPGRFDLVVVSLDGSARSIKRVIGLPGDTVEITADVDVIVRIRPAGSDDWHRLGPSHLDGRWAQPTMACCRSDGTAAHSDTAAQTVPDGHYFVLGDNPAQSADSRVAGWVPADDVHAVVRWRVWPPSRVGRPAGGFVLLPDHDGP